MMLLEKFYERFNGKLSGKTIYDFKKDIDYGIEEQQKRLKAMQELLHDGQHLHGYFEEFLSDWYNPHLTKDDCLSEDHNVFQELEKMANYIIYAADGEKITKKTKYNFYTQRKFEERLSKDVSIDDMVATAEENLEDDCDLNMYDEVIDFLIRQGTNYKKEIKQIITDDDLKDNDLEVVGYYQDSIDHLRSELEHLRATNQNKPLQYKIMSALKELKHDQLIAKDQLKGTIYFKEVLPDSTDIDYDQFDFFDKEHVMALLKMPPVENLMTDVGCLVYDLNRLLEQCELTPADFRILELYRHEDMSLENIADKLGSTRQNIYIALEKICNKIIDAYEGVYEDWYYLNKVKGKYKRCSKCKQNKIMNDRNFGKHSQTHDGLYPSCRICRKNV
jgi:predicted DNA-binding protein YlxM (UPF0122 family)